MNDEVFRWIVASGVVLATVAFVVQALAAIAISLGVRRLQERTSTYIADAEPAIGRLEPMIERATALMDSAAPQIEAAGATFEKAAPVLEKARLTLEHAGPLIDQARTTLANANLVIEENRPNVAEITGSVAGIARTGREQVERLNALFEDAGERARARLAQSDDAVTETVEQGGEMGGAVKRAMLRPVSKANGVAAGISAAVATLVKGRKSPPDLATQDEEMFI